ncbi:hypothetical protein KKB99_04275 [bacterium]|nr:hypothetical protein [bacterium]MBU1025210.1 hypothetical protein [bacterium]
MSFEKLNNKEKRQLFQFIAHLAILAGREMSEEGYQDYNSVVVAFLEDTGLVGDFQALAAKVELNSIGGNC